MMTTMRAIFSPKTIEMLSNLWFVIFIALTAGAMTIQRIVLRIREEKEEEEMEAWKQETESFS